jgi:hypothetical protein
MEQLDTNTSASTQVSEPKRNVMEVMDSTGHSESKWDPNNPAEVEAARASFDVLKRKGYAAFRLNNDGSTGSQMDSFDPGAGRVLMRAPMAGG